MYSLETDHEEQNPRSALVQFGFSKRRGGAHQARTMMLAELRILLDQLDQDTPAPAYRQAIVSANCLAKRSVKTRALSYRHLADLYALDPQVGLFRTLRFLWDRDPPGQPLLAALCAYARDPLFRASTAFLLQHEPGSRVSRQALEAFIDAQEPGRFSEITLTSIAQHINASWTQSGHLRGRTDKIRTLAVATPGPVCLALLLAYLSGQRGELLFSSESCRLLDCSMDKLIQLAEDASRRGWISMKRIGQVVEVVFPQFLSTPLR